MNLKKRYIKKIFTNLKELKEDGIYLSGIKGEGEYKSWYLNGQLTEHCFYKDSKRDGEYKGWWFNGQIWQHNFYKKGKEHGEFKDFSLKGKYNKHLFFENGREIDMPDNLKDGYILVDGKYYKD